MSRRLTALLLALCMVLTMLPSQSVHATTDAATSTEATTDVLTLRLSDSYGDGWNGNQIAVCIDGVFSMNYTISDGYAATYNISYDRSKSYEFKWIKGSYSGECSFTLLQGEKVLLSATKTECGNYASGQSLLILDSTDYDFEGEFAGGTGIAADPYLVATKKQLDNVRNYPYAHFRQVMDITFTTSDFLATGDFYNDGQGWKPIGSWTDPFAGYYDGNGCSITGLTINANTDEGPFEVGLFGYTYGDIVNVRMPDISYRATDKNYIGGIAGHSYGMIIGCHASGEIEADADGVGGIVGYGSFVQDCVSQVDIVVHDSWALSIGGIAGSASTVIGCENSGDISSSCTHVDVGGIVGNVWTKVSNCRNSGNITVDVSNVDNATINTGGIAGISPCGVTKCINSGNVIAYDYEANVGGIVGSFAANSSTDEVAECVNKGNVSASSPSGASGMEYGYAGGIVGNAYEGTIRDCYVVHGVTMTAKGTRDSIGGGIVGIVWQSAAVENCYSLVGSVSVNSDASAWGRGGIAGHNYGTVDTCYYRYTYGVGYNSGTNYAVRVSTFDQYASQSTYEGFDFTSIWQMGTGSYTYAVLQMENGHTHSLTHNEATVTHETSGKLEHWYCAGCDTYFRDAEATLYITAEMLASDPLPRTGTCGDNAAWSLSYDGVLTISGTGDMADYTGGNSAPWHAYRENVKTVVVEPGITSIGSNAFKDCISLCDVSLPEGVTQIGEEAFAACTSIEKLDIPEGVKTIGARAFACCGGLQYLLLPESVTSIGEEAFVSIGDLILCFQGNAPSINGSNIFSEATVSAHYPSGNATWTEEIMQNYGGSAAWTGFGSLEDVIIASRTGHPISWTLSIVGTLTLTGQYTADMPDYSYNKRPDWESYRDCIVSVKLVNVSRVGSYSFYEYPALEYVDFGNVGEIGTYAFYECTSLKSAFLPANSYILTIESYAFYYCSALRRVTIPYQCNIATKAFGFCDRLTEIYIGNCRSGCYGLTLNLVDQYYLSPASDSFYNVNATVYLPIGWSVKNYGGFGGTLSWQQAKYGPCGNDAYWTYDEATATITITGTGRMVYYSSGSEYPWAGLREQATKVVIEDGITRIQAYTFEYMDQIQTVRLPNTLEYLSCNAFNDCESLNNLLIPASITEFGSYGYFNRCSSLTDVYYLGTEEEWEKVENHNVVNSGKVQTIHFLVLTEQKATCTEAGTEAYYRFEEPTVYTSFYNLAKEPINQPATVPALGHDWQEANCTAPKTCTTCGATEGESLSHDWREANCTAPKTCNTCGATEGEALGHDWQDASCTESKTCHTCGATEGEALGHDWQDASCTEPKTCNTCGITEGEPYGHSYTAAVTTKPTKDREGVLTRHCDSCGDEQETKLPEISADAYTWSVNPHPTEKGKGVVTYQWKDDPDGAYIFEEEFFYGDANGDGEVSLRDALLLRQYLANRNPETGESTVRVEAGADADGDGSINLKDVLLMRKYLANRDIVTGESSVILGPQ